MHKSYAAPVLIDVDLDVAAGEVHALVGANGAGKTTLARILCGLTTCDSGGIELLGRSVAPRTKAEAEDLGIQMVMQELNLIPTLSVAENLYLSHLPHRFGFVTAGRLRNLAKDALGEVGLGHIDPSTPVRLLGVGQQQLVEIAAALARPCRLLILDEPTAALTDPEIDLLFAHVQRLKSSGVGIVYISHRMEEISRIADRATILRDGRVVETQRMSRLSVEAIVERMVGRRPVEDVDSGAHEIGEVALAVRGLRRGRVVRDVSFEVRRGEILGLAGLVGSGRTETLRAVFGADAPDSGEVRVGSNVFPEGIGRPRDAVRAGIGMIPEDRKLQGLLLPRSVRVNTTLARLGQVTRPRGWIDPAKEIDVSRTAGAQVDLQCRSTEQPVEELSGGNQQKVLISRWLLRSCDVMLFDEPTRGIDVAAKQTVYGLMRRLAAEGKALVIVSSELRELMALCDRIAVMSLGRVVASLDRGEWTEDLIVKYALSGFRRRSSQNDGAPH
jgi:ribose transport system ATP-binding protein